jgi:hypothetical protein
MRFSFLVLFCIQSMNFMGLMLIRHVCSGLDAEENAFYLLLAMVTNVVLFMFVCLFFILFYFLFLLFYADHFYLHRVVSSCNMRISFFRLIYLNHPFLRVCCLYFYNLCVEQAPRYFSKTMEAASVDLVLLEKLLNKHLSVRTRDCECLLKVFSIVKHRRHSFFYACVIYPIYIYIYLFI